MKAIGALTILLVFTFAPWFFLAWFDHISPAMNHAWWVPPLYFMVMVSCALVSAVGTISLLVVARDGINRSRRNG
jgi:uncharacterized BrkB/YihY/UPF0761 family membrane protein